MTVSNSFFYKLFYFIDNINRFLFEIPFSVFKIIGFSLSLLVIFLSIFYWIKLEKENRDELDYWQTLIKNSRDFRFLQRPNKNFEKIKKIFYQNKIQGLIELTKFFDFVLDVFGYEGNLEEKLTKIQPEFLPNLEKVKKAYQIIILAEEKLKNNQTINLTEDDYLLVFHEFEQALFFLNILTREDFLVKSPE